jgi:hypothetical protein
MFMGVLVILVSIKMPPVASLIENVQGGSGLGPILIDGIVAIVDVMRRRSPRYTAAPITTLPAPEHSANIALQVVAAALLVCQNTTVWVRAGFSVLAVILRCG